MKFPLPPFLNINANVIYIRRRNSSTLMTRDRGAGKHIYNYDDHPIPNAWLNKCPLSRRLNWWRNVAVLTACDGKTDCSILFKAAARIARAAVCVFVVCIAGIAFCSQTARSDRAGRWCLMYSLP